eukprot:TRINITY_DN63067_c0_g1_i1.p1 TRINITY_DN63067_c0_g1~~TRINITY_DN63067_c0_g1_i1.p1  ORF type:complete len:454 (-),score=31.76 TRINITY_DN63067_c0_g1_i1:180-1487(-)
MTCCDESLVTDVDSLVASSRDVSIHAETHESQIRRVSTQAIPILCRKEQHVHHFSPPTFGSTLFEQIPANRVPIDRQAAMLMATDEAGFRAQMASQVLQNGSPLPRPLVKAVSAQVQNIHGASLSTRIPSSLATPSSSPRCVSTSLSLSTWPVSLSPRSTDQQPGSHSAVPLPKMDSTVVHAVPVRLHGASSVSATLQPRCVSRSPSHHSLGVSTPRQGSFNERWLSQTQVSSIPRTPSVERMSSAASDFNAPPVVRLSRSQSGLASSLSGVTRSLLRDENESESCPPRRSLSLNRMVSYDTPRSGKQPRHSDSFWSDNTQDQDLVPLRLPANTGAEGGKENVPPLRVPLGYGKPEAVFWNPPGEVQRLCDEMKTPSFVMGSPAARSPTLSDNGNTRRQLPMASVVAVACAPFGQQGFTPGPPSGRRHVKTVRGP